jgi:hypothetical protein
LSPLNHNHPTVLIVYENIRTTPQDSRHQDTTTRLPRDPVMCLCYLLPLMTHDGRRPLSYSTSTYVRTSIIYIIYIRFHGFPSSISFWSPSPVRPSVRPHVPFRCSRHAYRTRRSRRPLSSQPFLFLFHASLYVKVVTVFEFSPCFCSIV